ncbi:hypothetical protein NFI96_031571 [Prochilodus magdalenae]|nr:hypothetical protein NFI96_031571 [Prochilodus magdalenae]
MDPGGKIVLDASDLNFTGYYDYNGSYEYGESCCGTVCGQDTSMAFEAVFIPVLYSLAVVVGLLGNVLVLVVLWQKKRTWSVTDTFVLHLSVADILLLLTMPLWAVEAAKDWVFGTALCKLTGALFRVNFYCGIFLLACISLDRYLSIVHAVQMYSRKKPWLIQLSCMGVWFFSLVLSIPDWLYLEALNDSRRGVELNVDPSVVLLFCYTSILLKLQEGSQGLQKQRAMRVIVALVVAFFVCWTPYNVILLADTIHTNHSNYSSTVCDTATALDIALTTTSTLGYLHSCINPVLYAFVGVKFRRHLLDMARPLSNRLKGRVSTVSRRTSMWSESGDTSKTGRELSDWTAVTRGGAEAELTAPWQCDLHSSWRKPPVHEKLLYLCTEPTRRTEPVYLLRRIRTPDRYVRGHCSDLQRRGVTVVLCSVFRQEMDPDGKIVLDASDLSFTGGYDYNGSYEYGESCCGTGCGQDTSMAFEAVFIPVLYSLAVVVGLLGNGLVLVVLWQNRRAWSVTDTFLLHLSLADILLLLTMPLWAVEAAYDWIFGRALCKLTGALFRVNFYCGIFLLACISLSIYLSIVHAVQMYSRKKPWLIQLSCMGVWFFSLVLSIPDWLYLEALNDSRRGKTECSPMYPSEGLRMGSRLLYHVVGFMLPAVVLLFCYTSILLKLQRGFQDLQKQRATRLIVALVVVAFFVCWTPYNIVLLVDTIHTNQTNYSSTACETATALDIALTTTSTLGYLHSCINPVLCVFFRGKFQRRLLDMARAVRSNLSRRTPESVDTGPASAL